MRVAAFGLAILLVTESSVGLAQISKSALSSSQVETVKSVADGTGGVPQFEVATIKPSDPANCCSRMWSLEGRTLSTHNTYLQWLIKWAYGLQDKQVVGGPTWIGVDRYDITAVSEESQSLTGSKSRFAMQKLLTDRFHLKFHHETREMLAYVVTVAHGGAKLTPSVSADGSVPLLGFRGAVGEMMTGIGRNVTLQEFLAEIQRLALDRPIVDKTGIMGKYDIDFQFTREGLNSLGMTELPNSAAPNLITAMDQELGLKLQGAKTAVDVIVIDRADPPSPN
jgi:uncharacterized protein (TIGR03435 family)